MANAAAAASTSAAKTDLSQRHSWVRMAINQRSLSRSRSPPAPCLAVSHREGRLSGLRCASANRWPLLGPAQSERAPFRGSSRGRIVSLECFLGPQILGVPPFRAMNATGMPVDIERREAVLSRLPQKAVRALEDGDTWETERPEEGSRIANISVPLRHEASDTWERRSIESRVTVTNGALVERFYSVDKHGAQALRRAPKWGSDRHRSVRERFSPEKRRKRWARYWEWVAETGRDPIGEFSVPETARCGWRLLCQEKTEGVFVHYARRRPTRGRSSENAGPSGSAGSLGRSTDYVPRDKVPRGLRDHCRLKEGRIHPGGVQSRADLARRFRRRGTGRIAGRQILDSELRRVPDDAPGPLHALPRVFFVDVAIEEPISPSRQRDILRARAREKLK